MCEAKGGRKNDSPSRNVVYGNIMAAAIDVLPSRRMARRYVTGEKLAVTCNETKCITIDIFLSETLVCIHVRPWSYPFDFSLSLST